MMSASPAPRGYCRAVLDELLDGGPGWVPPRLDQAPRLPLLVLLAEAVRRDPRPDEFARELARANLASPAGRAAHAVLRDWLVAR